MIGCCSVDRVLLYTVPVWDSARTVRDTVGFCHQSGTVLDNSSQLGTLLEVSGGSGVLSSSGQLWTAKCLFADEGKPVVLV